MFYTADLYPNLGAYDTRGKTVVNQQERVALGGAGKPATPLNIWTALLLLLGVVVVMGIFGGK